ncbi:MAG: hypothetical protein RIQ88_162 [Actinomycetota bacterium]|jgi:hypothetical protein
MSQQDLVAALLSLLPPLGMVAIVYFLFKSLIGADAKERQTRAKIEAEERAKAKKAKEGK